MDRATSFERKQLEVSPPVQRENLRITSLSWQPIVIGSLAFWLITGGAIIYPTNLHWMLTGDPSMNYLGWMFFRNTPLLQQPFGAIWPYGMEISGSTVYSDSLSILAFPFKFISGWLPENFQYFGLWTFICFLLQAFFGWKLLGRLTGTKNMAWTRALATTFFVLAPPFVWRIHWHFALASHWLLLASLYLYFAPRFRLLPWVILLVVASLVTPILLAMVILIFAGCLASRYFDRELSLGGAAKALAITVPILFLTMWEAGYFIITELGASGFGVFRASLTGLIDPGVVQLSGRSSWSQLFKDQSQSGGNYEGFCYLGTGTILLAIAACAETLRSGLKPVAWQKNWPLCLLFLFSMLFALSNNIAIGPHVLFHYDVPFTFAKLIAPFRASGRFIWIAYYLILTGVLFHVLRTFRRTSALILVSFALIVQIVDSWQALRTNRAQYAYRFSPPLLTSDFWQKVGKKYQRVAYVLPRETKEGFLPLCYFAAVHNMPIGLCHYGRVDEGKLVAIREKAFKDIQQDRLDQSALYVFETPALWRIGMLHMRPGDYAAEVDNLQIIAPAWNRENIQDTQSLSTQTLPDYQLGTELRFAADQKGAKYLLNGWSLLDPL
ncbi:MAG: hypothetical protein JO076_00910, partial [Verrucomicrobia bacterium]|nr:hypothetical protein [Verrucomicrobiota bacterium]